MGREPTNTTQDQVRLEKKMFSRHVFEIAEGRETEREFNQPLRGKESLQGKMQRMKS